MHMSTAHLSFLIFKQGLNTNVPSIFQNLMTAAPAQRQPPAREPDRPNSHLPVTETPQ